jgi:hypothetical protein
MLMPFLAFAVFATFLMLQAVTTEVYGKDTVAIVVGHEKHVDSESSDYELKFAFRANGAPVSKSAYVSCREYGSIADGQKIGIRYLPQYPQATAQLNDPRVDKNFPLCGFMAAVMDGLLALGIWKGFLEERCILKNGLVATGCVLTKEERNSDDSTTHAVCYQFQDRSGNATTTMKTVRKAEFDGVVRGQELTVFYLPGEPRRNVAYEFCNYNLE